MREPEPLHGLRVVARPSAIDAACAGTFEESTPASVIVIRIAPDDTLLVGATDVVGVQLDDPHAIVEPESAFVGWWLSRDEVSTYIAPRVEWALPRPQTGSTQLAQGLVAGVPMKLWFADPADSTPGREVLVIVSRGLAHEAQHRLFEARA